MPVRTFHIHAYHTVLSHMTRGTLPRDKSRECNRHSRRRRLLRRAVKVRRSGADAARPKRRLAGEIWPQLTHKVVAVISDMR